MRLFRCHPSPDHSFSLFLSLPFHRLHNSGVTDARASCTGMHVKSVFYGALGTMATYATMTPRTRVHAHLRATGDECEPRTRDHSPVTRSILEISSPFGRRQSALPCTATRRRLRLLPPSSVSASFVS